MATLDDTEPADFSLTHFDSDIQFLDPDEHEAGSLSCWPPLSLEPVSHDLGTTQVSKPSTQNGHARLNIVRRLCGRPPVRFAKAAVRVLEEWLVNHRDAPYATTEDLECLKYMTGLRRSQISNWLANARKRGKIQSLQPSASLDTSSARSSRMPLLSPLAHLHPFERWLYLDTEYGLCSISEIEQAMKKGQVEPMPHGKLPKEVACADNLGYTASNSQYSYNRAPPSITSMEIRSYAANAKSVSSDQWRHPFGETPSTMTRSSRRRRRPRSQICGSQNPAESESAKSSRQFQCTFCNDSFKKKHDWQRHEKSQHIPLETWVCCPQGSVNVDPDTNEISCVFCGAPDPDPEHIQDHKYTQCISRSPSERTFHRKDHLRQHLRLMHGDCRMILAMDAWMSEVPVLRSRCGFCEMFFDTWKARVEHLADHFRNGALMKHWEGDWGFDANILGILEKAMLPSNRSKGNLEINSSGSNEYGNLDFTAAPTSSNFESSLSSHSNGIGSLWELAAGQQAFGSWGAFESDLDAFPSHDTLESLDNLSSIDDTLSSLCHPDYETVTDSYGDWAQLASCHPPGTGLCKEISELSNPNLQQTLDPALLETNMGLDDPNM